VNGNTDERSKSHALAKPSIYVHSIPKNEFNLLSLFFFSSFTSVSLLGEGTGPVLIPSLEALPIAVVGRCRPRKIGTMDVKQPIRSPSSPKYFIAILNPALFTNPKSDTTLRRGLFEVLSLDGSALVTVAHHSVFSASPILMNVGVFSLGTQDEVT
jgi:hypothetical protein